MTGILLLIIVGLWVWACVAITRVVLRRADTRWWRWPLALVVFGLLLVLPVIDEIIGGFQFRTLCARDAVVQLGVPNPAGRVTRYSGEPIDEVVSGTAIPILRSHIEYHDIATGELVAKHDRYVVKGGLLVRAFGFSESSAPLTIGRSACSGERGVALPLQHKFEVVN